MLQKSPPFLTLPSADLKAVHKALQRITEKRTTIPVLEHALYRAKGGVMTATATDLERELTLTMACAAGEGETLLPVHGLAKTIANMGDGIATLAADGSEAAVLACGAVNVKKPVPATGDFPKLDVGATLAQFTADAQELGWALERPAPSISTEETRYYLNGVYLHWATFEGRTGLTTVATNGHELTWCRMDTPKATMKPKGLPALPAPEKAAKGKKAKTGKGVTKAAAKTDDALTGLETIKAIIPRKTVHVLVRLLERVDDGSLCTVSQCEKGLVFECQNWRFVSKAVDGTFPDWQRVMPQKADKWVTVSTEALDAAIERLKGAADGDKTVRLNVVKDKLRLSLGGDQEGVVDEIETIEIRGKVPEIGFNMSYVNNATFLMHGPTIRFEIAEAGSPARITDPEQDEDMGHVLMPMRVGVSTKAKKAA